MIIRTHKKKTRKPFQIGLKITSDVRKKAGTASRKKNESFRGRKRKQWEEPWLSPGVYVWNNCGYSFSGITGILY